MYNDLLYVFKGGLELLQTLMYRHDITEIWFKVA